MDDKKSEENSLENPDKPEAAGSASSGNASKPGVVVSAPSGGKKSKFGGVQGIITRLNIYLLLFIFIVIIAVIVVFIGVQRSKKEAATPTVNTQKLTADELAKLNSGDAKVGDAKQTLTIESNAIFSGKVLVRDSVDIAGTLKVGGTLSLTGLNVSGSSTFDQLQANKLSIGGDTNIQGQLTVLKNLVITGGASFGGQISAPQITVQSLQLNGDLTFTRHIDAGGANPGKSDGSALGSGGTSSVSGTDTAGTVTINTGGSPPAGCFITVSFAQKFGATPHVVVTPIGSAAGGLNFYVNRSSTNFSICTTNSAPGGANFAFDYIVID